MNIFRKFNNRKDYQEWVFQLFVNLEKWSESLWNEEDYPKLSPFFKWEREVFRKDVRGEMSEEVKAAYHHWKLCDGEYGKQRAEWRGAFRGLMENGIPAFLEFFGFKEIENDETVSEHFVKMVNDSLR